MRSYIVATRGVRRARSDGRSDPLAGRGGPARAASRADARASTRAATADRPGGAATVHTTESGPAPKRCKKWLCFLVNSPRPPQAKKFQGRSEPPGTIRRSELAAAAGPMNAGYFRRAGPEAPAG